MIFKLINTNNALYANQTTQKREGGREGEFEEREKEKKGGKLEERGKVEGGR